MGFAAGTALPCSLVDEDEAGYVSSYRWQLCTRLHGVTFKKTTMLFMSLKSLMSVNPPARLLTSSHPPKHMLGLVHVRAKPRCHPTDMYRCWASSEFSAAIFWRIRGHVRPKSRRIEGVEEDARKLGCKNWRADAQDRGHYRHLLEEAKAHLGL